MKAKGQLLDSFMASRPLTGAGAAGYTGVAVSLDPQAPIVVAVHSDCILCIYTGGGFRGLIGCRMARPSKTAAVPPFVLFLVNARVSEIRIIDKHSDVEI